MPAVSHVLKQVADSSVIPTGLKLKNDTGEADPPVSLPTLEIQPSEDAVVKKGHNERC